MQSHNLILLQKTIQTPQLIPYHPLVLREGYLRVVSQGFQEVQTTPKVRHRLLSGQPFLWYRLYLSNYPLISHNSISYAKKRKP